MKLFGLFGGKTQQEPTPEPIVPAPEKKQAPKPETKHYKFKVAGVSFRQKDIIDKLMLENSDYTLSKKEMIEDGLVEEKIYKYEPDVVLLVEIVPEPDNPEDPAALKVIADDVHIGYVPKEKVARVNKLLANSGAIKINCELYGGNYKYIDEDNNLDKVDGTIGAEIDIEYKAAK